MSDEPKEKRKTFDASTPEAGKGGNIFLTMLLSAVVFAAIAGAALVGGYIWVKGAYQKPGPYAGAQDAVFEVPRGAGLGVIAEKLEAEGLVSSAYIFRLAVELEGGAGAIKAGEFAIPPSASMAQIFDILNTGAAIQYFVTLPEGRTSAQIVAILNADERLVGEIAVVPDEGSLLPETYAFTRGTSRQDIIERMRRAQADLFEEAWAGRDPSIPVTTRRDAIILASIVEKETALAEERPRVAAVFTNRLRRGMRLETDPTIIYGITGGEPLGRGIRRSELDDATNLYNTYEHDGLPPTAICNPGRASILAVLNPPATNDLFFVADGTGGHAFAATYAEHQRNVARWRQIERNRANGP